MSINCPACGRYFTGTVAEEARLQVAAEEWQAAVDREKERIKARRAEPWWHRLLPFTVTITWRDQ